MYEFCHKHVSVSHHFWLWKHRELEEGNTERGQLFEFLLVVFFFLFSFGAGDRTQGLALARQGLYH